MNLKGDYLLCEDIDAFHKGVDRQPEVFVDHLDYLQEETGVRVLANRGYMTLVDYARIVKGLQVIVQRCRPLW